MQITFKGRKLKKQLTEPKEMLRSFGPMARRVRQRLTELAVADNLAIMRTIPPAGCHELTGGRRGELAVEVSGNYRIIFEPDHDPLPRKNDG